MARSRARIVRRGTIATHRTPGYRSRTRHPAAGTRPAATFFRASFRQVPASTVRRRPPRKGLFSPGQKDRPFRMPCTAKDAAPHRYSPYPSSANHPNKRLSATCDIPAGAMPDRKTASASRSSIAVTTIRPVSCERSVAGSPVAKRRIPPERKSPEEVLSPPATAARPLPDTVLFRQGDGPLRAARAEPSCNASCRSYRRYPLFSEGLRCEAGEALRSGFASRR